MRIRLLSFVFPVVSFLLLSTPCASLADERASTPVQSDEQITTGVGKSETRLSEWPPCVLRSRDLHSTDLCPQHGDVETIAFQSLRDRLTSGVADFQRLCEIDTILVSSEPDCTPPDAAKLANSAFAALLRLLAWNWKEQGALERADQLYGRAYGILAGRPAGGILLTSAVLQEWALLKLQKGELDR